MTKKSVSRKGVDPRIYRTAHWRRLKRIVAKRCGGRCERCGRQLLDAGHLHHLTYERSGRELESDVEMLCYLCHDAEHPGKYTWIAPSLQARYREEAGAAPRLGPRRPKPKRSQRDRQHKQWERMARHPEATEKRRLEKLQRAEEHRARRAAERRQRYQAAWEPHLKDMTRHDPWLKPFGSS